MTAFEVHVNGRKVCTAGIPEAGVVTSAITWVAGANLKEVEDIALGVSGLISRTNTHIEWSHRALRVGDEVCVVVTEAATVSKPKKVRKDSKASQRRRKMAYLKRLAGEFGFDLVKK